MRQIDARKQPATRRIPARRRGIHQCIAHEGMVVSRELISAFAVGGLLFAVI